MSAPPRIAVYGAGGLGREIRGMIEDQPDKFKFAGFFDDGVSPMPPASMDHIEDIVIAIAATKDRAHLATIYERSRFPFNPLIHPSVAIRSSVKISKGTIICAGVQLTVDISIGNFAIINLNATIGHDVRMGDCVSIMPGVNISGNVTLESRVFIGSGATILQGLTIGAGSIVGAGAVVTKNVPPNTTVVGVPARPMIK